MILLKSNQLNKIVVTLTQNTTLCNPEYLFQFVHIFSKEEVKFILPDVSPHPTRYNQFEFVEGQGGGEIPFPYEGQYNYYVYSQPIGSSNLNPILATELVENGIAEFIVVSADTTNENYFEFISDDEFNSNTIFAPDEINPITPSPTVPLTSTPTPSVTSTPTVTPTNTQTSTPTNTQTPTPTVTPTNTQTSTPTNTQTPTPSVTTTQTSTPTNTPTNTQTPTPSVTTTQTSTPTNTPTPSSAAFDADAAAYLQAVVSAGGTGITSTVSAATNTMFVDLKSAGIYTKLDALYPFLGGTSASCKWNAKDPQDTNAAFRLTFAGGITFSQEKGIQGNGTNGQADTYWIESAQTSTSANTTIGYFISQTGSTGFEIGAQYVSGWLTIQSSNGTNTRGSIQTGALNILTATTNTQAINFFALTRLNNSQVSFVRAGGGVQTVTQNTTITRTGTNVGLLYAAGFGGFTNRTLGTAFMGDGLTTTELGNLRDIITTFNTTLNRNI